MSEFLAEKNFKSYDELKARLNKVLGLEDGSSSGSDYAPRASVMQESKPAPAPTKKTTVADSVDDDEDLSYFEKLAED